MNDISFKANFERTAFIKQRNNFGIYKKIPAYFVKLDESNGSDRRAIINIANDWGDSLAILIRNDFLYSVPEEKINVYALTTQSSKLEELDPTKVLGLAEIDSVQEKYNRLNYLQTNPKYKHRSNLFDLRKFKHIGNALLDSIKGLANKPIRTEAVSAKPFYKKNGFVSLDGGDAFIWKNQIL